VAVNNGTLAARIVQSWRCGIVVSENTPFSQELIRLMQNKEELRSLGAAGMKAFHQVYNWDEMKARLLRLYDGLESSVQGRA